MGAYVYSREYLTGTTIYDINNPYSIDENFQPVTLLTDIQTVMPYANATSVDLTDTTATVNCDDLDDNQKNQLDLVVATHKSQTYADPTTYRQFRSQNATLWNMFISNDGSVVVTPA